jgi:acetyl-CoA carboxylase carboxyl transferase subunit alpha
MKNYLEFESEIKGLEEQLEKLKDPFNNDGLTEVDTHRINQIQNELDQKLKEVHSRLNRWQKTLLARHEERPRATFFINNLFLNFINLSGDRQFAEDKSVLAGFGVFENKSVLIIGQEKGEDLNSRIERNFGMMRPEGYRKCIRLMKLADKFNIPIISFVDTSGAYPGTGSEERNIAEAIARSIECSMSLKVPNISIIIGEGGSGGAIALASSNRIIMFENAIYSVISPEGASAILWRNPEKKIEAADAMKLAAQDLLELGIVDEVIKEPLGGAHRDRNKLLNEVKKSIRKNLQELSLLSREDILNQRKQKFLSIGRKKGFIKDSEGEIKMTMEEGIFSSLKQKIKVTMEDKIVSNLKHKINNNKIIISIVLTVTVLISLILVYL